MRNIEKTKPITVRFPMSEYYKMLDEAEEKGTTVVDLIRSAWIKNKKEQPLYQQLLHMEQRQRSVTFEMLCTVVEVSPEERSQALEQLRDKGISW